MKLNQKKEALIQKYLDLNINVHEKVFNGHPTGDTLGFDDEIFSEALSYLPNHIIKKWIKKCQSSLKENEQ